MGLQSLSLRGFRCFHAADLEFSPNFNLTIGENASGKTSLLEAIFLLSRGRSFRTAKLETATHEAAQGFQVVGKVTSTSGPVSIGLARECGQLRARIAGQAPESLAQLAEIFPVQLVDNQVHQLIRGAPRQRRQFLDWGVFHVEPTFLPIWRRYQQALRQRNALLRAGKPPREVESWDGELIAAGETLDRLRRQYLASLTAIAVVWAGQALGGMDITLEYWSGWAEDQALSDAIRGGAQRDRQAGMTRLGPHRAELLIKVDGKIAQERVSRGQEKSLAGALLLAQTAVYKELTGRPCTLLLDDLAAELDESHLARFVGRIEEAGAQAFITAIDPPSLIAARASKVFHVKQGEIHEMV
ncbi:MAG: DNA replication/repair protein RecF [Gammaproteobacteria bacterium]